MTFLKKIQDLRKSKNISQKKMSELLNISQPGYQKIEQGINVLSLDRFLEICRILGVDSYNELLPNVSADKIEEIQKVLFSGSYSFDLIRRNAISGLRILDEIDDKTKANNINLEEINQQLEFIKLYLELIRKEAFKKDLEFSEVMKLVDKID